MQKYTIKTIADDRADTIVYFPIRGNLGLINSPNFLRGYDGDDVRMVEATGSAGLLEKVLEGHLVGLGGDGQFLDGDGPVEERVVGQVDGAEGTPAQDAGDAVLEELLVGGEGHATSSTRWVHT